jgi:hypothetical protein
MKREWKNQVVIDKEHLPPKDGKSPVVKKSFVAELKPRVPVGKTLSKMMGDGHI